MATARTGGIGRSAAPLPGSASPRCAPGGVGAGLLLCRALGLAALVLVASITVTPAPNWLAARLAMPARLGPADAVVVLGASLTPEGALSSPSLWRLVEGIRLHRRGLAPLLVLSGHLGLDGTSEAEVRGALARELGIASSALVIAPLANSTREEGARIGALLRSRGLRRILLVTDSLHLVRAARVFAREGLEVLPAPADDTPLDAVTPEGRLDLARQLARELLGRGYYRLAGY